MQWVVAVGGVACVAAEVAAPASASTLASALDLSVGLVLLGTGGRLARWDRAGVVLAAAGPMWFCANLAAVTSGPLRDVLDQLAQLHRGLLVAAWLLLVPAQWARLGAVLVVASTVASPLTERPTGMVAWSTAVVALAAMTLRRWPRRIRPWAMAPVALVAGAVVVVAAAAVLDQRRGYLNAVTTAYDVGIAAAAGALVLVALRLPGSRGDVADAVLQVASGERGTVRALLADSLGDPALALAFSLPDGWIDELGRRRPPLADRPGRAGVEVAVDGVVVAELSCRADLARSMEVRSSVEAATLLVARNARLRESLRIQAAELADSRRRLVVVQDEQRRLSGQALQAAIAGPLHALASGLAAVPRGRDSGLDVAIDRLRRHRDSVASELNRLAVGLGPSGLTGGLAGALTTLVNALSLDVTLDLALGRLTEEATTTAYLVCAEAMANTVKHADASRVAISTRYTDGDLVLVVGDDGRGGASWDTGSGLVGLADRVASLGGTLSLTSPVGGGTTLRALVPRAVAGTEVPQLPIRSHGR